MAFTETRGNDGNHPKHVLFSDAILSPSASFGGLYVPETFPVLDKGFFDSYKSKSYKELAKELLTRFAIDVTGDELDALLLQVSFLLLKQKTLQTFLNQVNYQHQQESSRKQLLVLL